jgi:hypothetical protein
VPAPDDDPGVGPVVALTYRATVDVPAGGGCFRFYRLGEAAFDAEGRIRNGIRFPILAAHVWFSEPANRGTARVRDRFSAFTASMPMRCFTMAFSATGRPKVEMC